MKNKHTQVYEKLSQLQWLLQRYRMFNTAYGPFADTTRGQGRVMAALKMQSDISTKDLSYLLNITIPSLNELLNKLEKGGYIVRVPSDADKRVMVIQLTEKGKSSQQVDNDYSEIFNCLNEEELTVFSAYLDRVIACLKPQVLDTPDSQTMDNWMRSARSRMGDEQFDTFMSMGKGFGGGFAGHFRGGFGPAGRGMPKDIPGAERFDPNYDGPVPDRNDGFPPDWGQEEKEGHDRG